MGSLEANMTCTGRLSGNTTVAMEITFKYLQVEKKIVIKRTKVCIKSMYPMTVGIQID